MRLIGALVFIATNPVSNAAEISLVADEWYPYTGKPNAHQPGYMVEIATEIARQNGHTLNYQLMDWASAKSRTLNGEFDCVAGAVRGDSVAFLYASESMGISVNAAYGLRERKIQIKDGRDLANLRMGTVATYSYSISFDQFLRQHQSRVRQVKGQTRPIIINLLRLVKDEIDVVIEDENVADTAIKALNVGDTVEKIVRVAKGDPVYIACSPNRPSSRQYLNLFSDGVRELRSNGKLEKILTKYNLSDWAAPKKKKSSAK